MKKKNNIAIFEDFPRHLYDIKANFSVQVYQSEQEQTCTYEIPIENRTHRIELQKLYPWNEDLQAFTDFGDLSLRIHIGAEEQFGIQSVGELISRIFVFGMDSKIANQIPVMIFNEETTYKIAHLAEYHEIDARNLVEHLICDAYIEAEDAGVVPVDPWDRNPNPDSVLENETFLWDSFPEALRDLHIEHEIEGHGDEDGDYITIYIDDEDAKIDCVYMTKRFAWDEDRQCYNLYRDGKLEIEIEVPTDELDEGLMKQGVCCGFQSLHRMKTLDQLFEVVFGMSVEQKKWERGYV